MYRGLRRLAFAIVLTSLMVATWPFGPLFLLAWSFTYRHRVVIDSAADQAEARLSHSVREAELRAEEA